MLNLLLAILFLFQHDTNKEFCYSEHFSNYGARFNYTISGTYSQEIIVPASFIREKSWGGSRINLIDTFGYGYFLLEIRDYQSKLLIFSRPYNNLFVEWQMSDTSGTNIISFKECVSFPLPLNKFVIQISKRDSLNSFYPVFTRIINPEEMETAKKPAIEPIVRDILRNGPPETKLDIVLFSEGYTANQQSKFFVDAVRFSNYLNKWQPFDRQKKNINIKAVFVPSKQAGVDIPQFNKDVNTVCNATFRTFGIDRYLSIPDISIVYKYLDGIPCDQICILANSKEYGGGGIYNFYTLFTVDNPRSEFLFLHEFGHGFAALGDEYYDSEVSYTNAGSLSVEPYEPNITNLVDFGKKWKALVADSVPVPTPANDFHKSSIGVFEGANYRAKGFYRSQLSCAMLTSSTMKFCTVCENSIEQMIKYYSK